MNIMSKFFIAIYRFFQKRQTLMWAILIGSTLLFAFLASRIHFEENIVSLFPQTDRKSDADLAFSSLKVKDKIFVEFHARDGKEVSSEQLVAASDAFIDSLMAHDANGDITNCLWRFDDDMMVNALDFVINQAATFVTPEMYPVLEKWMDSGCPEEVPQEAIDLLADYTGNYSMVENHLFSPDSTTAIAYINPSFNSLDSKMARTLGALIRSEEKQLEENYPDVEVLYHGPAMEGVDNSRIIRRDLAFTLGFSLIIICFVICVCFKNRSTLPLLLSPVCYGGLFAMAAVYLVKGSMSFMAIGMAAVILGVALSYVLHVLTHYKYVSDPEQVIREQARPVCLGALTTIGAFVSLLFTSSELLSDFGIFATFSLIGTTLFALIFLPHFFRPKQNRKSRKAFRWADQINAYPLEKKYWLVGILVVIIAVTTLMSGKVQFDTDLNHVGYTRPKVQKSKDVYCEKIDKGFFFQYYAGSGQTLDEAIYSARRISVVLDSLKEIGLIDSRGKMQEILVPEEEQQANIDRWKAYWSEHTLPENAPAMAQALVEADYEPAAIPDYGVLPDELQCNFVEQSESGQWMVFVSALMNADVKQQVNDAVAEADGAIVIDPYYYMGNMLTIVHSDFLKVLLISSLFVLVVLLLSYLDVFIALLAFMPMFFSWYVVQGMMAILGIDFNILNIVISSFIFGIGVDYSIFVMDGLIDRERGGDGKLLVCHKTAILFSAFVLLTVVVSMVFSVHPAIYSVGVTTIIGMVATLLITHVLEPLLFRIMMKSNWIRNRVINNKFINSKQNQQ